MIDFIMIMILIAILIPIVCYMVKKKGNGCIGCPNASSCGGSCHCDHKELPEDKKAVRRSCHRRSDCCK